LKDHLRGHHYKTDKVQEAVQRDDCEELEWISTAEVYLRICNAGRNA
jgi:hypothetical protein